MLVVFDDEKGFREIYRQHFPKMGINMEVTECSTKEKIREVLQDPSIMGRAKVLVFDLSASKEEAQSQNFEILHDIERYHSRYPIPIFIHSAFAEQIEGFDNLGTLFKIKKGSDSVEAIINKIQLFYNSGFLEIFSPGGTLETQIHLEILKAFNEQFKGEEIELIIKSIEHSGVESFRERVKSVFERIAIRSMYQNLLSAKKLADTNKIEEIRINAVEHYYRRKSDFPVWTGDIFVNKKNGAELLIMTPRCDINNGYCNGRYLVCQIEKLEEKRVREFGKNTQSVHNYINDNPQNTGHKYRYLIPTPSYKGGRIDLTNYSIVEESLLVGNNAEFEYCISLSDELTNDVVRKYASYILRSGISPAELIEASFYSQQSE